MKTIYQKIKNKVNVTSQNKIYLKKKVKQIMAKTLEAKTVSSYSSLEILGKFVSQTNLLRLIRPFKVQLDICNSRKLLKKIEEALRRILLGFLGNTRLSTENLMNLAYGLLNDTFDMLKDPVKSKKKDRRKLINADQNDNEDNQIDENNCLLLQKSCLLIPSEPKRGGDKPKVLTKTNQHVIVEFALQVEQKKNYTRC